MAVRKAELLAGGSLSMALDSIIIAALRGTVRALAVATSIHKHCFAALARACPYSFSRRFDTEQCKASGCYCFDARYNILLFGRPVQVRLQSVVSAQVGPTGPGLQQ